MHDLSRAGNFKSFFGTGVCFYFRHFTQYLNFTLEVFLHRQNPYWTSSVNTVPVQNRIFGRTTVPFARPVCRQAGSGITGRKDKVEILTGKSNNKEKAGNPVESPLLNNFKYNPV